MITLGISVVVAVIGFILFWFSPEPSRAKRLGEIMLFAGLLAALLLGTPVIK